MADIDTITDGMAEEAALAMNGEMLIDDNEPDPNTETPEERKAALTAMYGDHCPFAEEPDPNQIEDSDWLKWAQDLWERHGDGVQRRIHLVNRNRLMYRGFQWMDSTGTGPWREPPKPRDAVRAVHNLIQPAIDQRIQIITEQRPGFRTKPITQDTADLKKAEAQQYAIEYQYDQQSMEEVLAEAEFYAQTDGVVYFQLYWDTDAGPWDEKTEAVDGTAGMPAAVRAPLGDLRTRIHRIEEVRVSANATASQKPQYWVIKTKVPVAEAARRFGGEVASNLDNWGAGNPSADATSMSNLGRMGLEMPGLDALLENQPLADMYTVFCEPNEYLPNGLQLVVIGTRVVYANDLLFGVVPMVRLTDGSADPSWQPAAIMEAWIDHQVRINALISKWIESVRVNSGGRFLVKPGTVSNETLIGGLISALEVRATGSINDAIVPVAGFSVGNDVKDLLEFEIKAFEQKSGWNDTSRGSVGSNTSGRAILAIREQLERVFAPPVNAAARAMTEWARIALFGMRWGYDSPRNIGVFGQGRPDLARVVEQSDFDGVCDVELDKETLMPMPRALRLFLLDQMYEKGQMQADEYRRRMPFAYTRNMASPDDDHESRAKRIADAILRGMEPPPMRWQDNEAIHQNVLEREIILDDSLPENIIFVADARWKELAMQAAIKMGAVAPPQAPAGGGQPPSPPQGEPLSPEEQPFLGTDPGVASAPIEELAGAGDIGGDAGVGYDFTDQF